MMTSIHSILNRLVLFSALFWFRQFQACVIKTATVPNAGQTACAEREALSFDTTFTETLVSPVHVGCHESAMVKPGSLYGWCNWNIQKEKPSVKGLCCQNF